MKLVVLTILVIAAALEPVSAQGLKRLRRVPAQIVLPTSIQVTTPSSSTEQQVAGDTFAPCGISGGTAAIDRVEWANAATMESGVAVGTRNWCVPQTDTRTVAQDLVAVSENGPLVSATPSPIGSAWVCPIDTTSGSNQLLATAAGYIQAQGSDATGAARLGCYITPSTAISGTDYDVIVLLGPSTGGPTDGLAVLFGGLAADNDDYCTLTLFGSSANPDAVLTTMVAGTPAVLAEADANPVAGNLFTVKVRGTAITVEKGSEEILSATTSACDNATDVGLGAGSFRGQTGIVTEALDSFTEASNTNLATSHAPDINGTIGSWVEEIDTCPTTPRIVGGTGLVSSGTASVGNCGVLLSFNPTVPLSTANYKVSITIYNTAGATAPVLVGGRYVDEDGIYGIIYGPGANPDVKLIESVGGVVTVLASADCSPVQGNVFTLDFVSADIVRFGRGGACQITGTVSLTATGKAVMGWGNISGVPTDDVNLNVTVSAFSVTSGSGGDTISPLWLVDSIRVVDQDATTPGIPLAIGANAITFTAIPVTGAPASVTVNVNRVIVDTQKPLVTILLPTNAPTFSTASGATNLGGSASDNSGSVTVSGACATCTPTSFTATWANGQWSYNNLSLSTGANTIVITAEDGAGNQETDTIVITSQATDNENPTISYTQPNSGSSPWTTTQSSITFAGIAADNSGTVTQVAYVCTNANPGSGVATGTTAWSFNVTWSPGTGTCTVTAFDPAGRTGTATLSVTRDVPLDISTTTLPNGIEGQAYLTCLVVVGGTTPRTISLVAGTLPGWATLNSSTGCVSGTPNADGVTTGLQFRVTDSAMPPATDDTPVMSLTIMEPGAEGPNDHWTALCADPARVMCESLRDTRPCTVLAQGSNPSQSLHCNYATDTNPEKIQGVRASVPQWFRTVTLQTSIPASTPGAHEVLAFPTWNSGEWVNQRGVRIGEEVATIVRGSNTKNLATCTATNPSVCQTTTASIFVTGDLVRIAGHTGSTPTVNGDYEITRIDATHFSIPLSVSVAGTGGTVVMLTNATHVHVIRGQFGTTPSAHAPGETYGLSNNSLLNQVWVPTTTTNGKIYLIVWDELYTSSLLGTGMQNYKYVNWRKGAPSGPAIFFEPWLDFGAALCPIGAVGVGPGGFDPAVHIGGIGGIRGYNTGGAGPVVWDPLQSNDWGPNIFLQGGLSNSPIEPIQPIENFYCARSGRIYRRYIIYEQRSGDYDPMSMYISDEVTDPVRVYDERLISMPATAEANGGMVRWTLEMNTSFDRVTRAQPGVPPTQWRDIVTYTRNLSMLAFDIGTVTAADIYNAYIAGKRPIR